MRTLRIAVAVTAALILASCGGSAGGVPSPRASPSITGPRPSSTAVLTIESPSNGEVVHGGTVRLVVSLDGAELVQAASTTLRPDQGHLHVSVDDTLVSMTNGTEQTIPDLAPGVHLIKVEFVANDHGPFDPRVISAVSVRVQGS